MIWRYFASWVKYVWLALDSTQTLKEIIELYSEIISSRLWIIKNTRKSKELEQRASLPSLKCNWHHSQQKNIVWLVHYAIICIWSHQMIYLAIPVSSLVCVFPKFKRDALKAFLEFKHPQNAKWCRNHASRQSCGTCHPRQCSSPDCGGTQLIRRENDGSMLLSNKFSTYPPLPTLSSLRRESVTLSNFLNTRPRCPAVSTLFRLRQKCMSANEAILPCIRKCECDGTLFVGSVPVLQTAS